MNPMMIAAPTCAVLGYAMGNFSPSYLIGKWKGYDVRKSGTGNAGASNTMLLAGRQYGIAVALLDILKAAGAGWIGKALFPQVRQAGLIAGTAAQLGHMFPVVLGFKGGKGFACMGGTCLSYDPKMLLKMLGIAAVIGFGSGYIALATISMSVIWPVGYGITTRDKLGMEILLIPSVPIFIRHIPNLKRIIDGEEVRMDFLWKGMKEVERVGGMTLAPLELRIKRGFA